MKILLLGFSKIKFMPYANFYLQNIDTDKHDVHLLYWNRDIIPEDVSKYNGITLHEFKYFQQDNVSHKYKIKGFLKYRKFANGILKKEKFDFVIVLHTMPGILTFTKLVGKFKDRFIFDYRDSTYERYSFFKNMIGKLIKSSKYTFTSSDGFRKFFPESEREKTYTSHNILKDSLAHREFKKNPHDKIRISFWGFIRDAAINRAMIERIANDDRFELHYYGREQQVAADLKQYAHSLSAENVFFHGEYVPEERYEFVRNTDLIHNIYKSSNTMLAMGNKYYDGTIFYVPQLCMKGSFMAESAEKAEIGLACDPNDENFTQKVYEYYTLLDKGTFTANCDRELERTLNEHHIGEEVLKKLFE